MLSLIKRFFTDADFCKECVSGLASNRWLRGLILGIGAGIAGGQIPVPSFIGKEMYWLVPLIFGAGGAVAVGEKNKPLPQLKQELRDSPMGATPAAEGK